MRDSVVFYRSFREAINNLPEEERLKAYDYIFDYAFDEKEPKDKGIATAIWNLCKPQIDANNQRYENGTKGGRPVRQKPNDNQTITKTKPNHNQNITEAKPNDNQSITKTKPNDNQTITKPKPNDNVNDNVNVNVNVNGNGKGNVDVNVAGKPPLPPAFILPCKFDDEYIVTQGELEELTDLYPNLDIMTQLRIMKGWLLGNKNKKLKDDIPKFMHSWLKEEALKASSKDDPKKKDNRLGVFADYKQTSTDDEWDDLTMMSLMEVNGR